MPPIDRTDGPKDDRPPVPTPSRSDEEEVVRVDRLRKVYGRTIAVADVSFVVRSREIVGVIGPNGAGKTTTVECVSGLRSADSGDVRVFGLDPRTHGAEIRRQVGVQLQESAMPPNLRVSEALGLFSSFYPSPADAEELLGVFGLREKRNEPFGKLSGGQKQRLSIALALIGNPRLAVLDELTTGLDPAARREIWQFIESVRARGVTVILVTHYMDEAERLCDRVVLIDQGRVVATDTPAGLASREGGGTLIRFTPSRPVDEHQLAVLPGVTGVHRTGERVELRGTGDLVPALVKFLETSGVEARDLQVRTGSLEDAFVRLTGRGGADSDGMRPA